MFISRWMPLPLYSLDQLYFKITALRGEGGGLDLSSPFRKYDNDGICVQQAVYARM